MSGSDSPTFFHGQPWSSWIEKIGRDKPLSDDESETEPTSSVTRLSADDIDLYGFCPERDTFYGVVCENCNAIVKPQALIQHMESRHPSKKEDISPPPPPPLPPPSASSSSSSSSSSASVPSSKPVLKTAYCKISKLTKKSTSTSSSLSSSSSGSSGSTSLSNSKINNSSIKRTAEQASLHSSLQTIAPKSPYDQISGIVDPVKSPGTNGNTGTTITTSSSTTTTATTTTAITTSGPPKRKRLKGDRGLLKDREYDADRHCGVWNDDTGKPCTRSLTCKAHTVSLRRTVPGRSKSFDKLLAEHRASKDLPNRTSKGTVAGTITVSTPTIGKNINNNNNNNNNIDNETPSSPPVLSLPDSYPLPKTKLEEDFVKEEMRLESSLAAAANNNLLTPISVLLPSLSPINKTELSTQVSTLIPATISSPVITTPLQINNQLPATVLEGETLSDNDNESMTLYSPVSLFNKDTKSQIVMQIPRTNSHIQSPSNKNYQTHGSSMPNITFDEQNNSPKNQLVNGKRIHNNNNNDNNSNSILLSPLGGNGSGNGGGGSSSSTNTTSNAGTGNNTRTTKRIKNEYTNEFTNIDGTSGSTSYPHYGDISWSNCHPEPLAVSRWLRITSTRKQYNFNIH